MKKKGKLQNVLHASHERVSSSSKATTTAAAGAAATATATATAATSTSPSYGELGCCPHERDFGRQSAVPTMLCRGSTGDDSLAS